MAGWHDDPWGDEAWGTSSVPEAAPLWIAGIQITSTVGANSRILNGTGSASSADNIKWSSEMNGGHLAASFRILESERSGNPLVYRYGAMVVMKIAPGELDAGTILFTGYMLSPTTDDDGVTASVECVGYQQLVREREDPLLWQTANASDWFSTDDEPAGAAFSNDNSIDEQVGKARLTWKIAKGQEIADDDTSRIGWWFQDTNVTRVAGTILKNGTTSNYILRLRRYAGPKNFASGLNVANYSTELGTSGNHEIITVLGTPNPMVTFELERDGTPAGGDTADSWKVWINDLRVNGDAYQEGRTPDDSYNVDNAIRDMAYLLGFTTGKVSGIATNCLPLWHQSGPWSDLFDHLATSVHGSSGWKWGVWDIVGAGPEIDFSNWVTNNTTWTTNAYTNAATTVAKIDPLTQDVYSKAVVTYRLVHSPRLRREVWDVSPNPFAGLDSWMTARYRAYRYHIDEPQRANADGTSTLAAVIARSLANAIGDEQYSGTVEAVFLTDGTGEHPAMRARAGDRLTIQDYPGGSKTFRIQKVDCSDDGPTIITIGDKPRDLAGLIKYQLKLAKQKRTHLVSV